MYWRLAVHTCRPHIAHSPCRRLSTPVRRLDTVFPPYRNPGLAEDRPRYQYHSVYGCRGGGCEGAKSCHNDDNRVHNETLPED